MGKINYIDCISETDIENILKNCGYKLISPEESEQQFGARPYRKHYGTVTCYCVVSKPDMLKFLERKARKENSEIVNRLNEVKRKLELIMANFGYLFSPYYIDGKDKKNAFEDYDSSYVRKVVFEEFFVKEIKKKNNKQNLFEKIINEEFESYMNSKFSNYAKQRDEYYQQLFSEGYEKTL